MTMESATLVFNVVATIGSAIAAIAAWRAVVATKTGTLAINMSSLIDKYRSERMKNDLENIIEGYRNDSEFVAKFVSRKMSQRHWSTIDLSRRHIHWYYRKCWELFRYHLLFPDFVSEFVIRTNGYPVFHHLVAPMTIETTPRADARTRFYWINEMASKWPPPPI